MNLTKNSLELHIVPFSHTLPQACIGVLDYAFTDARLTKLRLVKQLWLTLKKRFKDIGGETQRSCALLV